MDNLYKYTFDNPYHVSVGAIVFNAKGEICFHKFFPKNFPDSLKHLGGGLDEMYVLMRETLQDGESVESAVLRGVKEEFGISGRIEKYLGALVAKVDDCDDFYFEKTTLYHAVKFESSFARDISDIESQSELVWLLPEEALVLLGEQVAQTNREELNEIEIVRRFMSAYEIK